MSSLQSLRKNNSVVLSSHSAGKGSKDPQLLSGATVGSQPGHPHSQVVRPGLRRMFDITDKPATPFGQDGDPEHIHLEEADNSFAIGWRGHYHIDGLGFVCSDRDAGRIVAIAGYSRKKSLRRTTLRISNIFGWLLVSRLQPTPISQEPYPLSADAALGNLLEKDCNACQSPRFKAPPPSSRSFQRLRRPPTLPIAAKTR